MEKDGEKRQRAQNLIVLIAGSDTIATGIVSVGAACVGGRLASKRDL